MKTILTKSLYILLLINLLFLIACNKTDNNDTPEPIDQDVPKPVDKIACRLIKETDLGNSSTRDFEYNVNGHLIKETKAYQYAGNPQTLVIIYTYDSGNRLVKTETARNDEYESHRIYEYNNNGKIRSEKIYYTNNWLNVTRTYFYGADDNLIKITQSNGDRYEYIYDTKENLISIELYDHTGALLSKHTYGNYDDKINYYMTLNGYQSVIALSKNNPGRMEVEFYQNGEVQYRHNMNYIYEYNSKGFPIEITYTNETKNFSKKFSYICD